MKIMLAMLVNLLESLDQIVVKEARSVLGVLKDLLTKLGGERGEVWLGELKKFCRGEACWNNFTKAITPSKPKVEQVIDFDTAPFCPPGLAVAPDNDQIASRTRGKVKFSELKVSLHLDDGQEGGKLIKGYDLRLKLNNGQKVYGAQLLDFYLENPDLIPEDWKAKGAIFFWGTIYCDFDGRLYVRCLNWDGTRWVSGYYWLDFDWDVSSPAAVSASKN